MYSINGTEDFTISQMIDWKLAEEIWNSTLPPKTEKPMVKRSVNAGNNEPEQMQYELPTAKEHLFQVVDVFDSSYEGNKFNLDDNTVIAKMEVVGGEEEGRTLLQRLSLDDSWKGFFATRLFLKAVGEPYKYAIDIDTDRWIGRQTYALVVHAQSKGKTYANIWEFNFDKVVEQYKKPVGEVNKLDDIAWNE